MNKTLIENLKRIHTLTYGKEKSNLIVENYVIYPLEEDDEDKADEVTGEVNDFFKSLEVSKEDGLSVEEIGSMEYKKSVESLQIGLILLFY